jgi:hypothetical protein
LNGEGITCSTFFSVFHGPLPIKARKSKDNMDRFASNRMIDVNLESRSWSRPLHSQNLLTALKSKICRKAARQIYKA